MTFTVLLLSVLLQLPGRMDGGSNPGNAGSPTVEVKEGVQSVVLPCQGKVSNATVVVWSREKIGIIHSSPPKDTYKLDQRYKNRTLMQPDALQSGNLDLTLLKPTQNDSGLYKCEVREFGVALSKRTVELNVTASPVSNVPAPLGAILGGAFGAALVLALVALGVLCYKKSKSKQRQEAPEEGTEMQPLRPESDVEGKERQTPNSHSEALEVRVEEEESGAPSVQLTLRDGPSPTQVFKIKWTLGSGLVHSYSPQGTEEGSRYKGRTRVNKEDFSLTLLHPTSEDDGCYTCTLLSETDTVLKTEDVELLVRGPGQSVQLKFIAEDISDNIQMKWFCGNEPVYYVWIKGKDSEKEKIYNNRAWINLPVTDGDLTLNLRQLKTQDSGLYICEVLDFGRDPFRERKKWINLKVLDQGSSRLMAPTD